MKLEVVGKHETKDVTSSALMFMQFQIRNHIDMYPSYAGLSTLMMKKTILTATIIKELKVD